MSSDNSLDNLIISVKSEKQISCNFILQIIFPIIGGFMFGYDTGVVSGALLLLREYFHLTTIYQEMIVSATVFAAAISSLIAGFSSNRFGRKKTLICSTVCFIIGALVLGGSVNIPMLIIGRVVIGLGVGMSATCCPIYISEVSPEKIRGRLVVLYQISITLGMFFAAIVDASFYYLGSEGWRYMLGGAAIPGLIEFFGMLTIPESYRWLLSKNRVDEARAIIRKQNQIPDEMIEKFIEDILQANIETEKQLNETSQKDRSLIYQIFNNQVARQSLFIGCCLQMLQQICGINTIMYYTASVIQMSGVESKSTILWLSALVAFFNFIPSFIGYLLIDKIGRRKLAIISLIGVFLSLVVLAVTFQVLSTGSSPVISMSLPFNNSQESICGKKLNCEDCILSSRCGFCYIPNPNNTNLIVNSTCLVAPKTFGSYSSNGWCAKSSIGSNNGSKWLYGFCKSEYSWIIVVGMVFYLISFTIGMGPIPWAITSEIYPIWCRSTNMAFSTATNWIFNLIISLTFLSLTEAITKYGTFWLYSSFAICGIGFIYKFLPETNQKTLEEINQMIKTY